MVKEKRFQLNWFSKYRDELFGISIIAIILFHYCEDYHLAIEKGAQVISQPIFRYFVLGFYRIIGSIGVEIFAFLSGMGLYYSYTNNCDIKSFYTKRIKRLLLPYVIVAGSFWIIKDLILLQTDVGRFLADFSFITLFTEGVRTHWFILFILLMYLLFPWIYKFIFDGKNTRLSCEIAIVVSVIVPIILCFIAPELYDNVEIAITRTPIFILGCYMGKNIKEKDTISVASVAIACVFAIGTGMLNVVADFPKFINRNLVLIYSCGIMILLTSIFHLLQKVVVLRKFLEFWGNYTLELYILHTSIRNILKTLAVETYKVEVYFIIIVVSILLGVFLNKLCYNGIRIRRKK